MPYSKLTRSAFWKLCRKDPSFRISDIYAPKFRLETGRGIATAGSCFAQNISRFLVKSEFSFLDVEPAPKGMDVSVARRFGYGLYSARYGNIYTARQLRQLLEDAIGDQVHDAAIWEKNGRFFDALRPGVEPEGLSCADEVRLSRLDHLRRVKAMIRDMDVFIFTLGLTEAWQDRATGIVFPTAPGVIAGQYDDTQHAFTNAGFADVSADLTAAIDLMRDISPNLKIILTVSPVPLTATASGQHVLSATVYSKSVLRAVAGEMAAGDPNIDYFPSYEIITGVPFGTDNYDANLRTVSKAAVKRVMTVFFGAHNALGRADTERKKTVPAREPDPAAEDVCEEVMLEAFAPK
ncbi:GSCFA domain-containing protein [Arenibacterium sp. CAU 1754]